MSDTLKSLLFAGALCLTCSLLLTAASSGLKSRQQQNIALDRQMNILKSLGLADEDTRYSVDQIQTLYNDNVRSLGVDPIGRILDPAEPGASTLPLFLHMKDEDILAYVIPVNSRGLWGKIHGYLAIDRDGETVTGFTVYKHSETPGLGGEIEKQWFRKNFVGKKIVNRQGRFVSIGIAKGAVADSISDGAKPNYVDGISGATLTGRYLSSGIKEVLTSYESVSLRFRKNRYLKVDPVE